MTTIMPQSEMQRRALTYIDNKLKDNPGLSLGNLLDEAGARFNLSPKDSMALQQLFADAAKRRQADEQV